MESVPGRTVEVALLESACREVRSGAGRLVLLTGEAGIGKTVLAAAAADLSPAVAPTIAPMRSLEPPWPASPNERGR